MATILFATLALVSLVLLVAAFRDTKVSDLLYAMTYDRRGYMKSTGILAVPVFVPATVAGIVFGVCGALGLL